MELRVFDGLEAVAQEAAGIIAAEARSAVAARGRFVLAVSGGKSPWRMLQLLASEDVPWSQVHIFQVDERIAPAGSPDRNLEGLRRNLLERVPISEAHVHPMPVDEPDLESAARDYVRGMEALTCNPPVLDLVHLGLGPDGHTASLIPGDPVLEIQDRDVAITGPYQGRRRMTLTYPVINRARRVLWLVIEADKREALVRLLQADLAIPAGRIQQESAIVLADSATGAALSGETPTHPPTHLTPLDP
jgi:6-phosphogluconolactonase